MAGATIRISQASQSYMPIDLKPGRSKICQNLPAVAYQAKPLGMSSYDGRNMPTVAPTIVRMAIVSKLKAKL
jgi:hypothetical protein